MSECKCNNLVKLHGCQGQDYAQKQTNKCPFKAGDLVMYKPSRRGHDSDDGPRLKIGGKYKIERIEKDNYIVVEGYKHVGGGIFWSEFVKYQNNDDILCQV